MVFMVFKVQSFGGQLLICVCEKNEFPHLNSKTNCMAQLILPGKDTRKKQQPLIDMTPMVDLGFLLITFFIFTSTLAEPAALNLLMPKESEDVMDVPESKGITAVLLGNGQVMVYEGLYEEARQHNKIVTTTLSVSSGLGALIRYKQKRLGAEKAKLFYLIKPTNAASYKDVVQALDEATINGVQRYAITGPSKEELAFRN
jgi:biopolymer transport protein ExbD